MAHGVVGFVVELVLVAVATAFGEVGVSGREDLLLLAGVEAEDGELVLTFLVECCGCFLSLLDGLLGVGQGVLGLAYLDDGATAVPAVGREELLPEGVVDRECGTMENGMRLADAFVGGCAVLQVELVAVGLVLRPLGSRASRLGGEVILCTEVIAVVVLIDGLDILGEALEGFLLAVLIQKEGGDGRELGVGLESREDEDVLLEEGAHGGGHWLGADALPTV